MPIPYNFSPGQIAASSEVNANFAFLAGIIGADSDAATLRLGGDLLLGPRDTVQITAKSDASPGAASRFCQIGWNADLYLAVDGSYKVKRIVENGVEGGTALRVGSDGVQFWGTAKGDGDLQDKFQLGMSVHPHTDFPWVYVNEYWKIQTRDQGPGVAFGNLDTQNTHKYFRNTLVFCDPPIEIIGQKSLYEGSTENNKVKYAWNLGDRSVPRTASGLLVYLSIESADDNSTVVDVVSPDAGFEPTSTTPAWSGFRVTKSLGAAQGIVRLGNFQTNQGGFLLVARKSQSAGGGVTTLVDARVASMSAWIQGYFV